ncbi:MAG: DUF2723 domain-containing protein [Candidatus Kapaibacterium sp.]
MKFRHYYSLAAAVIAFAVYALTSAPGLMYTDSGELAGVCSTLGIAHPTGYPLFAILGYLWSLIPNPFENIRWLNIFSAFLTAVSAGVFYHSALLAIKALNSSLTKAKESFDFEPPYLLMTAFAASLMYAFAATVWAQGLYIEVYSLHLLLMNLVIFSFLKAYFSEGRNQRWLLLTALFIGLGFANHMTTLLLLPAVIFIYFYYFPGKNADKLKFFLLLLIPFVLGLLLYIYLPVRASQEPLFNWGYVSRGLDKFLYHVQGKQYQVWMFQGDAWGDNFKKFFTTFPYEFGWIGIVPLLAGLWAIIRRHKPLFWFLAVLIVTCIAYSFNYSIHDIEAYFLTAFAGLLLFVAAGLFFIIKKYHKYAFILLAFPLASLIINYGANNESDNYVVPEYTRILMENLEEDAIIISAQWDFWCSAFWYMQQVEGYRPDVALVEKELLRRTWYPHQMIHWYPELEGQCGGKIDSFMVNLEIFESGRPYDPQDIQSTFIEMINCFIDQNYGKRPIYVTLDILQTDPSIGGNYNKVPQGFALKLVRDETVPLPLDPQNLDLELLKKSLKGAGGHIAEAMANTAAVNIANMGRYAQMTARPGIAESYYRKALELDAGNSVALNGLRTLEK